jgi:hypothetical protein
MTALCIHELGPGQCAFCREVPFGIESTVFKTSYGKAYHNWNNCEYLESGQKFAESKGGNATEIVPVPWSKVAQDMYPCEWCCALFYAKNTELEDCIVDEGSISRPGKIVKDRYLGRKFREYIIFFPESGDIEVVTSRYVKRFR